MGTLAFTATVSLDGYAADADGDFQWSAPSDEVFGFHIERMADVAVEVLGRRTYELMSYWLDLPDGASDDEQEFARRWQQIEVVAASSTMTAADLASDDHRLVGDLTLDELRRIVDDADGAVEIFGPTVATPAIRAGMVEHFHIFVVPRIVGGGLRALPDDVSLPLALVDQRRFGNTVYLHYRRM